MEPVASYPLRGKVTVDNAPPVAKSETARLVADAYDAAKPNVKAANNPTAFVNSDGSFDFPQLRPGKYVMIFAQLQCNARMGFSGPDGPNNLYNDLDVNGEKTQVAIDHQAPGKTEYEFNLSVAGETPPAAPGPKAFVGRRQRRRDGTRTLHR
ncbi:MAG TPA: hypothetical protein VGP76_32065 [Planctomycetaceae bacterium]|jgi:hypothetical protein|nr:hypothetical protein [Planctomycetaceae bacterium]